MTTNGVNGANGKPKTAADFKPEELQNAKQEKVKNTIFELDEAIANDVEQMYADNEIDNKEMDRIYDWVHVIDNMIGNMSAQVKQSYSEGMQILKEWVADLIEMTGMGKYNGQNVQYDGETVTENSQTTQDVVYEPQKTDSAMAAETPERLPSRMYWKQGQDDMQQVYDTLMNPTGRYAGLYKKPQAKIGAIMGFISQYANRLDKGQIAFLRQSIQNLNEEAKRAKEEELASLPEGARRSLSGNNPLPDADKVSAYWNAVKSAGFSHDLKAELLVLGYSQQDAKRLMAKV